MSELWNTEKTMQAGKAVIGVLPLMICPICLLACATTAMTTTGMTPFTTVVVAGGAVAATGCLIMGRCACSC